MNLHNSFKKIFWLFSIPRLLLIKTIYNLNEKGIKIKLRQKDVRIKNQQSKIFNQYKLEMKRRTSVSPKKHGEWLQLIFISKKTYHYLLII